MPQDREREGLRALSGYLTNAQARRKQTGIMLLEASAVARNREKELAREQALNQMTEGFLKKIAQGVPETQMRKTPMFALEDPFRETVQRPHTDVELKRDLLGFGLEAMKHGNQGVVRAKEVFDLVGKASEKPQTSQTTEEIVDPKSGEPRKVRFAFDPFGKEVGRTDLGKSAPKPSSDLDMFFTKESGKKIEDYAADFESASAIVENAEKNKTNINEKVRLLESKPEWAALQNDPNYAVNQVFLGLDPTLQKQLGEAINYLKAKDKLTASERNLTRHGYHIDPTTRKLVKGEKPKDASGEGQGH